jgi:group I intron endonuclease
MIIYRAVNKINSKSYVGKTEKTLEIRKKWHLASVKQKSKFAFHRAIAKYGIESFDWEVIYLANNLEDLNSKEQHYINLYESFGPAGYNMTAGGEGQSGWIPSKETRKIWSEQRQGKTPWNAGKSVLKAVVIDEEKAQKKLLANQKRSKALKGRATWNKGVVGYAYTKYKVVYKDGNEAVGTRVELGLPKQTIDTMFRDKCGSRKYNIMRIERS